MTAERWVLDFPSGVVCTQFCTCHGVSRKKVWRGNLNFLRWAAIYVAQSHWHTAASRNRKVNLRSSLQQRWLRMVWSRNQMRWDGWFRSCDLSDLHMDSAIGWKLTKRCSNKTDYTQRSFNLNLQLQWFQFRFERGHWSCSEDYSDVWGSLFSSLKVRQLMKLLYRKHRRSKCKSGSKGIQQVIKELLGAAYSSLLYGSRWHYSILGTINEDASKISAQNRWAIAVYKYIWMRSMNV